MRSGDPLNFDQACAEAMRYRVLRARDAAEYCGISLSHLRRLHSGGQLPAPVRLGERRLGWRLADLIDWLDSRRSPQSFRRQGDR